VYELRSKVNDAQGDINQWGTGTGSMGKCLKGYRFNVVSSKRKVTEVQDKEIVMKVNEKNMRRKRDI
jgi:hypothetical protein